VSTIENRESVDVLVVGAGQAGLAVGYYLKKTGLRHVLLDREQQIGDSWARRYDSLKLFTKKAFSSLPELSLTGSPHAYPTKDEIAQYLKNYAAHFALPVKLATTVARVSPQRNGFLVTTNNGTYLTRDLVLAAGAFQEPFIPDIPGREQATLSQWHSSAYTNPAQIPPNGPVLVVGGGNSGAQIAYELAQTRQVVLSIDKPIKFVGHWYINVLWNVARFEPLEKLLYSKFGKRLHSSVPVSTVIGKECESLIGNKCVAIKGKITKMSNKEVSFADGTCQEFQAIIWATGFKLSLPWLAIPSLPKLNKENVSQILNALPGLHYIYRSRHSEFLGWVHRDAKKIVATIAKRNKLAV
jgi:putative flavoprotein involved in K+ transport